MDISAANFHCHLCFRHNYRHALNIKAKFDVMVKLDIFWAQSERSQAAVVQQFRRPFGLAFTGQK